MLAQCREGLDRQLWTEKHVGGCWSRELGSSSGSVVYFYMTLGRALGLLGPLFSSPVKCQALIRQRLRESMGQFQAGFRVRGALLCPNGVLSLCILTSIPPLQGR